MTLFPIYFGIMSGTSMDGVDVVALEINNQLDIDSYRVLGQVHLPFEDDLRLECMRLQSVFDNEMHHAQLLSNRLAELYSQGVNQLLEQLSLIPAQVRAIGVHGQTIRHRPEFGYTIQLNQPAIIAERTSISIVSDFRARDIAAGGQGAPLVPAFHDAIWRSKTQDRVVLNIGGFSNISVLNRGQTTFGFDTGPGNVLMDLWIDRHQGLHFDKGGAWAAQGQVVESFLGQMLADPYFKLPIPKSTGRDYFHEEWLQTQLTRHQQLHTELSAVDVQATLLALTAQTVADAVHTYSPECHELIIAGGGAYNDVLCQQIFNRTQVKVSHSQAHGFEASALEAAAFAWLAYRTVNRRTASLSSVTGARHPSILGNITLA